MITRHDKGRIGEELAARYLEERGLQILDRNFRCPLGEIDLIARDGRTLVFVEVKSRYGKGFGLPQEAVTHAKRRKLTLLAQWYLKSRALDTGRARFDVLGIVWSGKGPELTWIVNAFEATS